MAQHECDHQDENSPKQKKPIKIQKGLVRKVKCHKNASDQNAGYWKIHT